jgi:2-isopropylmalate synthase
MLQSLVASKADVITLVAKTWDFQVTKALGMELAENLELIYDSVAYLKDLGFEVFLDAEHFFDGNKANRDYSFECIEKACEAGADMIVLCDTNGGTLPAEVYNITSAVTSRIKTPVGGHFHNDTGVAVANSMFALDAGPSQYRELLMVTERGAVTATL